MYCIIKSDTLNNNTPIYLLWFEVSQFGVGHYQSIEVKESSKSQVSNHYNWTKSIKKNVHTNIQTRQLTTSESLEECDSAGV